MNCQNCDAPVLVADECCEKCGAKLLHRRVFLGSPKPEDFTLTQEEPQSELEEPAQDDEWRFPARSEFATAPSAAATDSAASSQPRYGGFWRRVGASLIDLVMILLIFGLTAAMSYIGFKVGLAAHNRSPSLSNASALVVFLTLGWIFLATAYFVVFHGMDGRTIGKSLLGLRVVGPDQAPISYRRALLRWLGTAGFGCASIGLSFLWIVWSAEKRGWHDLLARTWVIRD